MQKNILFIIDSLGAGGAEKAVLTLARTMVKCGHTVTIITIDNIAKYKIEFDVTILSLDFKKSRWELTYPKYAKKLQRLVIDLELKFGRFDLITSHLQKSHRLTALAKISGAYYCIHSIVSQASLSGRSGLRLFLKRRKIKSFLDGKDIITVSKGAQDDITQNVRVSAKTIRTIYNPLDFEQIKRLALAANPYAGEDYIIHVGRLVSSKRHDILLKAYARTNINEKLLLLGDGDLKSRLQSLTAELGIESKVIFAGFHQNPYPIMNAAAMYVATSDYEGFLITLVEALALGVRAISTDCPYGPGEILVGPLSKYLLPVGDIECIANKIEKTLSSQKKQIFTVPKTTLDRFETNHISNMYIDLCGR